MIKLNIVSNFIVLFSWIFLTSCTVGPNFVKPKLDVKSNWSVPHKNNISSDKVAINWWKIFNDELLKKYIQEAIENNNNIKTAFYNLKNSKSFVLERRAAFIPSFGLDQESIRRRTSGSSGFANAQGTTFNTFTTALQASWQIDLFGGNKRALESAKFLEESSKASYNDVILTVITEVATRYFEIRQAQRQIEITKQNAKLFKKTVEIIDVRVKFGESDDFDLVRSQGEYQNTISKLPNLEGNMYSSIFALSILLGKQPEYLLKEMSKFKTFPKPPDTISIGTRIEMLSRRPDIRIAENIYGASIADIGVEISNLYPKFNLLGNIGSDAFYFKDMLSVGPSKFWSISSFIDWPFFAGGAIRARVLGKKAISMAEYYNFKQTVLEALSNTETALIKYEKEYQTYKQLQEVTETRKKAMMIAVQLFDSGETDYLSVLDVERELTSSQEKLVDSKTQAILNLITLYGELGGGWELFGVPYNYVS